MRAGEATLHKHYHKSHGANGQSCEPILHVLWLGCSLLKYARGWIINSQFVLQIGNVKSESSAWCGKRAFCGSPCGQQWHRRPPLPKAKPPASTLTVLTPLWHLISRYLSSQHYLVVQKLPFTCALSFQSVGKFKLIVASYHPEKDPALGVGKIADRKHLALFQQL